MYHNVCYILTVSTLLVLYREFTLFSQTFVFVYSSPTSHVYFSVLVLGVHYWAGTIIACGVSECEMSHSNLRKAISLLLESTDLQELFLSFSDLLNTYIGTKCSPKVTA